MRNVYFEVNNYIIAEKTKHTQKHLQDIDTGNIINRII